jgi:dipeptidyl aminopeptidase/acylaminoacyl peptidase
MYRTTSRFFLLSAAFLILVVIVPAAGALEKHEVTPTDIADLRHVHDAEISPDGAEVAYVVTTPLQAGAHEDSHIWVVSTDGRDHGRLIVYAAGSADSHPHWAPQGHTLAFLSDRPNPIVPGATAGLFPFKLVNTAGREGLVPEEQAEPGKPEAKPKAQLWLLSPEQGEAIPLTNISGGVKDFRWSPDGKSIALIRTDDASKEERKRIKDKFDQMRIDKDYKYDRLWVYTLNSHELRLVTTVDENVDAFDWSPDGTRFVVRVSPTPRINDYWRISRVEIIGADNGKTVRTIEPRSGAMAPQWSQDGNEVLFSVQTPKTITQVHVVENLDSGHRTVLEDLIKGTVKQAVWPRNANVLWISVMQGTQSKLFTSGPHGESLHDIPGVPPDLRDLSMSHDGRYVAYVGETPKQPGEVWMTHDAHSAVLTDTNPQVESWLLGTQKEITWKSSVDGRTIYGVLVLPPGYTPGKAYKTVLYVHGGPEEGWQMGFHGTWYDYAALLSSHGYVVLLANPRGSDGQGPAFAEANYQDWGGGDYHDIMDGVTELVHEGIADPDKLVIGGWSYGGFMTSWTVTQTNRFKAAMVGAAVTDLFSMATTTDISPSFETGYFGDLAANEKLYDERSPVRHIGNCVTPVLVLHGQADPRVPLSQGEEFYHGLLFRHKSVEMITYPREPHIFTEHAHQVDSLQRILDWYDSHLGVN